VTAAATRFAKAAEAAGWRVQTRTSTLTKATFTTEAAPEDSKDKATRTKGDDVEVPAVVVLCVREGQRLTLLWKDGKSEGAALNRPLRTMGAKDALEFVKSSHTWPCRWLPARRGTEICEVHGHARG
jgi:hypothetical protein